jgi:hypothetical protein
MPPVLHFQTWPRSPGDHVTMNYAWSTVGFPTLFISQSLSRNCTNESFRMTNENEYMDSQAFGSVHIAGSDSNASVAIVFRRLIEFEGNKKWDFNSSETLNETLYHSLYLNESIDWWYDPGARSIVGRADGLFERLTFKFQLPERTADERISYFPKTKYTLNSTVVDMSLLHFNYSLKHGRIALEMVMVNGQQVDKSSTRVTSTVDDEYTPSVFRTWEYYFNDRDHPSRAYLQWKPISYQNHHRRSTISQEANVAFPEGKAIGILNGRVPRSLASALFSDWTTELNGTALYMAFGTQGDGNYINSTHMTWTAVVGFGRVPHDTISTEVIIIIAVALGVPALLIFFGSFYVTYKKKPWQNIARGIKRLRTRDGYETIN